MGKRGIRGMPLWENETRRLLGEAQSELQVTGVQMAELEAKAISLAAVVRHLEEKLLAIGDGDRRENGK